MGWNNAPDYHSDCELAHPVLHISKLEKRLLWCRGVNGNNPIRKFETYFSLSFLITFSPFWFSLVTHPAHEYRPVPPTILVLNLSEKFQFNIFQIVSLIIINLNSFLNVILLCTNTKLF